MDDNLYFIGLVFIAGFLVIFGISMVSGSLGNALAGGGSGFFASAFAAVETNWTSSVGQFLITFDNFKNSHQAVLDEGAPVKVFDVSGLSQKNVMWSGTDHGLFLSRDGGLTWNRFTSSNNEINSSSLVFKILPASNNSEDFFISVFSNGQGAVYRTYDYFFNLEKLMDFDGEGAYDIYRAGNYLYFAMSTGQIIRYNTITAESRVVNVFSSPVIKIYYPGDGYFYVLLKDGTLTRANTLADKFQKISIPGGGWLFGSNPTKNVVFDSGSMYILTGNGAYASYDSGKTFSLLKRIPIIKNSVDALGVNNGVLYIVSQNKLYISHDGGENWSITQLNNQFKAFQFYFVGQRAIISM